MQGREKVLGNLRKELHIGNDAHAEIMDCVLSGKDPPRVAAAAVARCIAWSAACSRIAAGVSCCCWGVALLMDCRAWRAAALFLMRQPEAAV